jgi:hypothetical protein
MHLALNGAIMAFPNKRIENVGIGGFATKTPTAAPPNRPVLVKRMLLSRPYTWSGANTAEFR